MSYAEQLAANYAERRARLMGWKMPAKALEECPALPPPLPMVRMPRDVIDVSMLGRLVPLSDADQIILDILAKHKLSKGEFFGRQRSRRFVIARQEACWRMSRETTLSLPQMGKKLKRDHTSVLYSIRRYDALLKGEVYDKRLPRKPYAYRPEAQQ